MRIEELFKNLVVLKEHGLRKLAWDLKFLSRKFPFLWNFQNCCYKINLNFNLKYKKTFLDVAWKINCTSSWGKNSNMDYYLIF